MNYTNITPTMCKELREEKFISVARAAKMLNVSKGTIVYLEMNKQLSRGVDFDLSRLALRCYYRWLIEINPATFSCNEVAKMLDVSLSTVYRLIRRGELKAIETTSGYNRRVTLPDLQIFVKKKKQYLTPFLKYKERTANDKVSEKLKKI